MTTDERCARCGNPLPGADPDELDVCVPCATIVALEAREERVRLALELVRMKASYLSGVHPERQRGALQAVAEIRAALDSPKTQETEPVDLVAALRAAVEAAKERREAEAGET
jgi:isopropylmalate/homocitrate/citramalate synthase